MKLSLPALLAFVLLLAIAFAPVSGLGQTIEPAESPTSEQDDEDPAQRVARLSFIEGEVSFLRDGVNEWAEAAENLPLLTGDQVFAGRRARAEVQLGRGNYIRLFENTALTISDLSHTAAQFEITEGIAIIRLERFGEAFERFEVDTPNAALVLERDGLYRVNVRGDNQSEVIAHRGSIEVTTTDGSFKVREGHRLMVDNTRGGRLEIALDNSRDEWDQWSYDRDTYLDNTVAASSPDFINTTETTYNDFYGASELSNYGTWTSYSSYGQCWVPRVTIDWDPYRNGQWIWIPRIGLTWHSNDPWGWAPYHYGRWEYISGLGWGWFPGIRSRYNYGHRYYRWRPALVRVFNASTPRGGLFGWVPLRVGEPWRRFDNRARGNDHAHLRYPGVRGGGRRGDDDRRPGGRAGSRDGVTVIPIDALNRPDRSGARPQAPDRTARDWIARGARPGLPALPSTPATAPAWHRGGERERSRPAVTPPAELIKRPVLVRNRPADSQVGSIAPRERHLVLPRAPVDSSKGPALRDRGRSRGDENAAGAGSEASGQRSSEDGDSTRRRIRPPRTEQTGVEGEDSGRNQKPDVDRFAGRRPGDRPRTKENADKSTGEGTPNRGRIAPLPTGSQADKPRDNGGDEGNRKPPSSDRPRHREEQSRPRNEEQSRPRPDHSSKPRADSDSAPRNERPQPRPEAREDRQERRQEKEERRQERREERQDRRKP